MRRFVAFGILGWALAAASQPASQDRRHFGPISIGEPIAALPFPCDRRVVCEGQAGENWYRVNTREGVVYQFIVVYNEARMTGGYVVSHTLELVDALRLHSYAISTAPFQLALFERADGSVQAWVDVQNHIVYMLNPDDEAKGITSVVYAQADAPVFKQAKRTVAVDDLAAQMYQFIGDGRK